MTPEQTAAVVAELKRIEDASDGLLTPDAVWQSAEHEDSPLHPFFKWDLRTAAIECWREQARTLIRIRYTITHEDLTYSVPRYIRDPEVESGEQGYRAFTVIRSSKATAAAAVAAEIGHALAYLERARNIAVGLRLERMLPPVIARVQALMNAAAGMTGRVPKTPKGVPPGGVIGAAKRKGTERRPRA